MFSRSSDRPAGEDNRRTGLQPVSGMTREIASSPVSETSSSADYTVIAREDRVDGTVRAHRALRVLGQLKGTVEAPSVTIEEGAKVTADVTADEVVVSGEYSGNLLCRQRLEVRPSGRLSGRIETLRMLLHEGGFIDGELHMIKAAEEAPARTGINVRGGASETEIRQPVAQGAEAIG